MNTTDTLLGDIHVQPTASDLVTVPRGPELMVMGMNSYNPGDEARLHAWFRVAGVLTDPATLVLTVVDPQGASQTLTPVQDDTGVYHADLDLVDAAPGVWGYRWVATGAAEGTLRGQLRVRPSYF